MTAESSSRYSAVAIALHWAMAALILFMIWLGWNMEDNEARFQLHKSIGITILFLTLSRLAWRFANPPPPLPEGMPALEKTASHVVHVAFYALMIGVPLVGWFMVSVSPFQISTVLFGTVSWPHLPFTEGLISEDLYDFVENLHSKSAWVILGLLALHVAGALKHEFAAEDGVLKRMIPVLFGKPAPPALPPRGALFAFGASLALFAAIAAVPVLFSGAPAGPKQPVAAPPSGIEANWIVDYDASRIAFTGVLEGKPFEGAFESWTADVEFHPDDLAGSLVLVTVETASATTGTKLYDDTLKGSEWFNTAAFPQATVELTDFKDDGEGYTASATLTLKGKPVSVPLTFTLDLEADTAGLKGAAVFSRSDLDLGQKSDAGANWVSDRVDVTLSGRATRKE